MTLLKRKALGRPWVGIAKNDASFLRFVQFKAVNVQKIRFSKDVWLKDTPLELILPDLYSIALKKEATVADCWVDDHCDWMTLRWLACYP